MLPDGWSRVRLGDVADVLTGFAFPSEEFVQEVVDSVRLLRGDNVMQSHIRWDEAKHWRRPYSSDLKRFELEVGDVVLALDRPVTGAGLKCSVISATDLPCLLVQRVARTRAGSYLDQSYLAQALRTDAFAAYLVGKKTETAVPHASPNDVRSFEFLVPVSRKEQHRIAQILTIWDAAIATAERLLDLSRTEGELLAQALLSGHLRRGTYPPWRATRLDQLIRESRIVGSGGDQAHKLTVKLYGRGVVAKGGKRAGSESTQYYLRSAGQFIYSKLDFLNGAFGLIPPELDGYESTLDLPAFDFLPNVEPRWFLHHVSREAFYLGHLGLANGGRKARRVNPVDLMRVSIDLPCLAEQRAIAETIDHSISLVRSQERFIKLLGNEKAALMADLITGKRRVRLPITEAAP